VIHWPELLAAWLLVNVLFAWLLWNRRSGRR
jgi:hypothetical protein